MRISFRNVKESDVSPLLAFSGQMFGAREYQSFPAYLDWLYRDNPHGRGLQDAIIAVADDKIVGMVHRMALPATGPTGAATLLSLQNHVIAPDLRGGAGIMLLRHASRNAITFSPGVHGRLGEAYRRLGYVEVPSFSLFKLLRPVRGGAQLAMQRAGLTVPNIAPVRVDLDKVRRAAGDDLSVSVDPAERALAALALRMNEQTGEDGSWRVNWTQEMVGWRFFSPSGPRHILMERGDDWAILSIGRRFGLVVARLIERGGKDPRFKKRVFAAAKAMGAAVAMSYSTKPAFRDVQLAQGWRLRKDPPVSFANAQEGLAATAATGDIGFEAFGSEIRS